MVFSKLFKLFSKDAISFLVVKRYDLQDPEDNFCYIGIKPKATKSMIRFKLWHLLNLPDYCEEKIVLKSQDGEELPLTVLCKGNNPRLPYILEVWLPEKENIRQGLMYPIDTSNIVTFARNAIEERKSSYADSDIKVDVTQNPMLLPKFRKLSSKASVGADFKSDVFRKLSVTSFTKLSRKSSQDNFVNVLMKIQNDLSSLSLKMNSLEKRVCN